MKHLSAIAAMRRVKRMGIGKLVFSLLIFCMVAITTGCGESSKALEVNRELKAVNDEMHERYYGKAGYHNAKNFVMKVKWF